MKGEKTFFAETFSLPGWGPLSVDKLGMMGRVMGSKWALLGYF